MYRSTAACILLAAAGMTGCATPRSDTHTADDTSPPIRIQADAALPQSNGDSGNLFQGSVRAGVAEELIDYQAHYTVVPGNFLRSLRADADAPQSPPTQLGTGTFRHQLRTALPTPLDTPLRLGFESRQQSLLTLNGEQTSATSATHLQWAPKAVKLDVQWSPPRATASAAQPLDCTMQSNLHLPADTLRTGADAALEISQRQCQVLAPGRGLHDITLHGQAAAWRWGDNLNNSIRVQRLDPATHDPRPLAPGYELGLSHRHLLGDWRAEADVAVRRTAEYVPGAATAAHEHWTANVLLRREWRMLAVTARWAHANDPLWFAPTATPIGEQRWSLGLDFKPWLASVLPGMQTNMTASWRQTRNAGGGDDHHLNWNFSVLW